MTASIVVSAADAANTAACPFCSPDAHPGTLPPELLWRDDRLHVVLVDQSAAKFVFPGFCRVIWNGHVAEMTDLAPQDRAYLMDMVWAVEAVQRSILQPDKINLASLGNMVPHLHWHLIPRWRDDSHFPEPIWRNTPNVEHGPDAAVWQQRLALVGGLGPELHRRLGAGKA